MKSVLVGFASLLFFSTAHAAVVESCKGLDNIAQLVGAQVRAGNYSVAVVSTTEPSEASEHVLIISYGDDGYYSCRSINANAGKKGFCEIDSKGITSQQPLADATVIEIPTAGDYNTSTGKCDTHATVHVQVTRGYPDPKISIVP